MERPRNANRYMTRPRCAWWCQSIKWRRCVAQDVSRWDERSVFPLPKWSGSGATPRRGDRAQRSGQRSLANRGPAGRFLRAQAARKQVFLAILPLFSDGLIRPAEEKRPARKDYQVIKAQVRVLGASMEDADSFMAMTNAVEQAATCISKQGVVTIFYTVDR